MNFDVAARKLGEAQRAEDIFGPLKGPAQEQLRAARRIYRSLAVATHPDKHEGDAKAEEAFRRLGEFWAEAERLIHVGLYGVKGALGTQVAFRSKKGRYMAERELGGGDLCRTFKCFFDTEFGTGDGFLKVVRSPRDNDLVANEAKILKHLLADKKYDEFFNYLPTLIDSFVWRRERKMRRCNVLERIDGFYTLAEIRRFYPDGLDPRHVAWIWRRLLVALGFAHRRGVVHGAIVPEHVLIHPTMHGLILVDWSYATTEGNRIKAVVPNREEFYPKEVFEKKEPKPGTDIYMAARCMQELLLGGRVVRQFGAFFQGCTLPINRQPDDAWELKVEFDELIDRLWIRKYIPLSIPGDGGTVAG